LTATHDGAAGAAAFAVTTLGYNFSALSGQEMRRVRRVRRQCWVHATVIALFENWRSKTS